MSISFQSTSASTVSRGDTKTRLLHQQFPHQQQQQQQHSNHAILGAVNSGISPLLLGAQVAGIAPNHPNMNLIGSSSGSASSSASASAAGVGIGQQPPSFLGGIFNKRERKLSKSDEASTSTGRSTEV